MTGRYKAYPEYKESGVDWLHDIPEHWKTMPVGRCYHRVKRTGYEAEELLSVYRDYGVVPKSSRDDNNNKPSDDLSPYQLVCENNLVMNKMKAWQGSIAISAYRGIVSPAYFVYEPFNHTESIVYPKYVHYLLRHPIYITQYMSRSKGIRVNQWDLDPESFQSIELLLPLKEEQQKIINFLDHETAKIDTLITKQEKLIELLKEKRQAVISHAVTKGLNPDATMKDSGVEWLGEVPEHWDVGSLNHFLSAIGDVDHYMPTSIEKGVPYVMTGDLTELASGIVFEDCKQVNHSDYLKLSKRIKTSQGDVIMARYATIGTASYVDIDKDFLVSYSCVTIKPSTNRAIGLYLFYYFKSQAFLQGLQSHINTNTQGNVGVSDLKKVKITLPNLDEQKLIIEHLQSLIDKFDDLSEKSLATIELMKERKKALISAAVTGKIDIRDWQGEA